MRTLFPRPADVLQPERAHAHPVAHHGGRHPRAGADSRRGRRPPRRLQVRPRRAGVA